MTGDARDSEAAWRELVAHYAASDDPADSPAPWPDRENLPTEGSTSDSPGSTDPSGTTKPASPADLPSTTEAAGPADLPGTTEPGATDLPSSTAAAPDRPRADDGTEPGIVAGDPPSPAADPVPGVIPGPPQVRIIRPAAPPPPPPAEEDEHFVPPPPPPLPQLDPVSKGAWAALFGGPAYLLIAVLVNWQISSIAAFIAVAAFVGGFATLVMRMGDRPPNDSGPDDGAVV